MKISVVIPAYNAGKFIAATIESVIRQTRPPDEILVLVADSKDDTLSILNTYRPRVTIFRQSTSGISAARNELCKRASGDLIAFLDADDIWHSKYLDAQHDSFLKHPKAVAFFTGHVNFYESENYIWGEDIETGHLETELIASLDFFRRYNTVNGPFASMSYCCVSKAALEQLGAEPFHPDVRGCEDSYLLCLLSLHGPVAYTAAHLAAYRIWRGSLSHNRVKLCADLVTGFEILESKFLQANQPVMFKAFQQAFAQKRRQLAKVLLGTEQISEARDHLWRSLANCPRPVSMAKSFRLLGLSFLSKRYQPSWPADQRRVTRMLGEINVVPSDKK